MCWRSETCRASCCKNSSSIHAFTAHLSLGVFAELARHVVGALDERAGDVVVVDRDDGQRNQEVNQEDHHRVDLRMHLIGQRVGHAVHEGHVSVVSVTLRRRRGRGKRRWKKGRGGRRRKWRKKGRSRRRKEAG